MVLNKLASKGIKKIIKIFSIALVVTLLIPALGYLIVQYTPVQQYLVKTIAEDIAAKLNTEVNIDKVSLKLFNRLSMENFHVTDTAGDTLVFSHEVTAYLKYVKTKQRVIYLNRLKLENARIKLQKYPNDVNIQFLIDYLRNNSDTTRQGWDIRLEDLDIVNSNFAYQHYNPTPKEFGINFGNIVCSDFNLKLKEFRIFNDTVSFQINELSFYEISGIRLNKLSSELVISKHQLNFSNLKLTTDESIIHAEFANFSFDRFRDLKYFRHRVNMNAKVKPSKVSINDAIYIVPGMNRFHGSFFISGDFYGKFKNLKAKSLTFEFGQYSRFYGDINFDGLPNIDETFMFITVNSLRTRIEDYTQKTLSGQLLPVNPAIERFYELGDITYTGNFTGFLNDFVAYGKIKTDLGDFTSDISLKPDTLGNFNFSGMLGSQGFNPKPFIGNVENIGTIDFDVKGKGSISNKGKVQAFVDGKVHEFTINNYNYQDIRLAGILANKRFDGSVNILDPNISLQFLGRFDYSTTPAVYDFTAYIPHADLYRLNIDKNDTTSILSALISTNFSGNSVENFNGKLEILNTSLKRSGGDFLIDKLAINSIANDSIKDVSIESNYLNGYIKGNYTSDYFLSSVKKTVQQVFPAFNFNFPSYIDSTFTDSINIFDYKLEFLQFNDICKTLFPTFRVADTLDIKGKVNLIETQLSCSVQSSAFNWNNNLVSDIHVNIEQTDTLLNTHISFSKINTRNKYLIENVNINLDAFNDTLIFSTSWKNIDSVKYEGDIRATAILQRSTKKMPDYHISILPSMFYIKNSAWNIAESHINSTKNILKLDGIELYNHEQRFKIDGEVGIGNDSLTIQFDNFDLDNHKLLRYKNRFNFQGTASGIAILTDIFEDISFESNIRVKNLFLNKNNLGDLELNSTWNQNLNALDIYAFSNIGNINLIDMAGYYIPKTKQADIDLSLNKVSINIFDNLLETFSDINGIASGNINLSGTFPDAQLNGQLKLQESSFHIDYLNTSYFFDANINITNNTVLFNNVTAFDEKNNTALLNGTIEHDFFKNLRFDLQIDTDNLLALNTLEENNSMYYGEVYAGGAVEISGPIENLEMNIIAQTNANTKFFIPLNSTSELTESNFIIFKKPVIAEKNEMLIEEEFTVDVSNLNMNFDLEVTPDAEVEIIFDSKIGDVVKAKGSGNFTFDVNTAGNFNMYGNYEIEQGEYMFTLQNVINKRFKIQSGSQISWNGSPYDATSNLEAIYELKAPLYTLLLDTSNLYKRRVPVYCKLFITNNLMNPDVSFDIELPTSDEETKERVKSIISNEDILNRQILSLLVLNSFLPPTELLGDESAGVSQGAGFGVTTSELLSNQLSHWLSQISNDFDIGVNYRQGYDLSSDEIEVALSTQLLNDRISVNGNLGYGNQNTNTGDLVGEFNVDVKLDESGKLRFKAFTRANDKYYYEETPYTQGIGVFYRESFNSFKELVKKYFSKKKESDPENLTNE